MERARKAAGTGNSLINVFMLRHNIKLLRIPHVRHRRAWFAAISPQAGTLHFTPHFASDALHERKNPALLSINRIFISQNRAFG